MLPQPPPDAPAPPPSEAAIRSRRWWKWMWITGILSFVLLCFIGLLMDCKKQRKKADLSEAHCNAHPISIAMIEFQLEYGKYPDATTIAAVEKATSKVVPSGTTTSNDFFRQLYIAGFVSSEHPFYAKGSKTHKPDGVIDNHHFLEKGECGFTYFLGAIESDNKNRPIVVAPMIPGTDRFDPEPFDGNAVILKMDNSTSYLPIDKDGHVILDGRNLMDPHHPIWDGHPPTIAWPDL